MLKNYTKLDHGDVNNLTPKKEVFDILNLNIKVPVNLTGYEILVYCHLVTLKNPHRSSTIYVYPECIALNEGLTEARRVQNVTAALLSLFDKGAVKGSKVKGSHVFMVDLSSLVIDGIFVTVPYEYIARISTCEKEAKSKLLSTYLEILKTRDNYTKLGRYPQEALSAVCHCSTKSLIAKIKVFEELGVLKVKHNTSNTGVCNLYGLPEDMMGTNETKTTNSNATANTNKTINKTTDQLPWLL